MKVSNIEFPEYTGIRCLMLPYIQGDSSSVPEEYRTGYEDIINNTFIDKGSIGYLTIDESVAKAGKPHRGDRSKFERALHTEAGIIPNGMYAWGGSAGWGGRMDVILDRDVKVLVANSIDDSCAVWDAWHEDTSVDGDIGDCAELYPYNESIIMKAGDVHEIGILTPHESLPVKEDTKRQFIRIVGSGVHGQAPYFTSNPLMNIM